MCALITMEEMDKEISFSFVFAFRVYYYSWVTRFVTYHDSNLIYFAGELIVNVEIVQRPPERKNRLEPQHQGVKEEDRPKSDD